MLMVGNVTSWGKEWGHWLKSRGRQQALQFPFYLAISSIATLILVTILYALSSLHRISGELFADQAEEVTVLMFVAVIILFALSFVWLFLLSFHKKSRKWADKYFGFRDQTELEELKMKVGNIETKLETIETILENLANKGNPKSDERA